MKCSYLLTAVPMVFVAAAALAQAPSDYLTGQSSEYVNRDDAFTVDFRSNPALRLLRIFPNTDGTPCPPIQCARGENSYSVTSSTLQVPRCPTETRLRLERAGAVAYAATALRQRGEVTYDAYAEVDMIPGHSLQVTEPDGRRLYAQIVRHEQRLYILEVSVPAGATPPIQFSCRFRYWMKTAIAFATAGKRRSQRSTEQPGRQALLIHRQPSGLDESLAQRRLALTRCAVDTGTWSFTTRSWGS